MGNSFGCSASGERLVSAARDGDLVEAKMLLDCNPCLAKYSTFGGLNSPLHFAAAKGHNEVVFHFSLLWYSLIHRFFDPVKCCTCVDFFFLVLCCCWVDCCFAAGEWSWCEFQKLLWTGMIFTLFVGVFLIWVCFTVVDFDGKMTWCVSVSICDEVIVRVSFRDSVWYRSSFRRNNLIVFFIEQRIDGSVLNLIVDWFLFVIVFEDGIDASL